MKLSIEAEGSIQDKAAKIFSWDKLRAFGKTIGVETKDLSNTRYTKRSASEYIMANAVKDDAESIVLAFIQMSKLANENRDLSAQMVAELNPVLEKTMKCKVDISGKLTRIFPLLNQDPT
jgi:hypothetical protein